MPGKGAFERCVESVEAKGSAYSPRGVCAAAGRKKYGKKRFQEMAKAGKRRAARKHQARSNPTAYGQTHGHGWIQEWYESASGDARKRTAQLRKLGYHARSASMGSQVTPVGRVNMTLVDIRPGSSGDAYLENVPAVHVERMNPTVPKELQKAVDTFTAYFPPTAALGLIPESSSRKSRKSQKRNPKYTFKTRDSLKGAYADIFRDGVHVETRGPVADFRGPQTGEARRKADAAAARAAARDAIIDLKQLDELHAERRARQAGTSMRGNPAAKRNPVDAAIEAFEEFHGEAPKTIKEFTTRVHYHGTTAGIGELIKLKIRLPRDREVEGGRVVTLKGFKGAMLTENPQRTQLFIEGGDQSLDLEVFGISEPHEVEHLGECVEVTYFTTKKHLGRDGGTANYVHKFGGEPGEAKTPRPQMIYRTRDKVIEFAGGGYSIPPEGIDG